MNETIKRKLYVFSIIFFAGIGGVLYGYDIGVISGALLFMQKTITLSQEQIGFIVGGVLTGGLVGTLIAGKLADSFGRKTVIISSCFLFFLGIALIITATDFWYLFIARLSLGIGVGVVAVTVPLYLTEIAPTKMRGRSVTIFQLMLTFGIVLAYFVDLLFVPTENWKGMFAVILIPTTVLLIGMSFLPESPRWLLAHNKAHKAKEVLLKTHEHFEAEEEYKQIEISLKSNISGKFKDLFSKKLLAPLTVALVIAICNQLTGINVLLQYAPLVIQKAGLNSAFGTMMGTVGIGLINFLVTGLAFFLIDRFGRKFLLIFGTAGVVLSYIYLGVLLHIVPVGQLQATLSLVGFFAYIFFFAIGPGVVVWLAISELLPTQVRGQGVALCLFANSLFASVLSTGFLMIESSLGMAGTYFLFAGFTLVYCLTAIFYLPETKGKTLEQIQEFFNRGKK